MTSVSQNGSRPPDPEGRLELTWTNKRLRLIDGLDGSYEWVDPADWRVAEVRLLDDVEAVGEVHAPTKRAQDNLLIEGDALAALRALTDLPEFAKHYVGQVKLVYLDPPFNTGQAFESYDDALEHSVWLTMLRDRLLQIKRLLRPDGSVWLHLDDTESHRGRAVLDEVFGPTNHIATVIWEKSYTRENRSAISIGHDYIHGYAVNRGQWAETRNLLPPSEEQRARYHNPDNDPRGPWKGTPAHAKAEKGRRAEQFYTVTTPSGREVDPPAGNCWRYTKERLDEMIADGRIWFGRDGSGVPTVKKFLSEVQEGLVPKAIWTYEEVGTTGTAKDEIQALFPNRPPFSTPKPERLLERLIQINTNPHEIVLDCFVGSGTTAAVAHKMDRRWVAVERGAEIVADYALPRLQGVVSGSDEVGISVEEEQEVVGDLPEKIALGEGKTAARVLKAMRDEGRLTGEVAAALAKHGVEPEDGAKAAEAAFKAAERELRTADKTEIATKRRWSGGGGFRHLRVAPSMFTQENGRVFVADWACQGHLAQSVAAQLGYAYSEHGRFVGVKGRRRLAVIDGLVSAPVLEALASELADGETMEVAGRALTDDARETARKLVKGARVRKIPSELLSLWRATVGVGA